MSKKKETPLMKQYKEIKGRHQDSILFFRLGDFYEMFFEDAKISSRVLGITLTSRNKEKGQEVPMAGVPFHSAGSYIAKLVTNGYKVAICEQVSDPKEGKGIVEREVVRVITPGTIVDTEYLDEKSNNYLVGIYVDEKGSGVSYVDITTGEFVAMEFLGKDTFEKVLSEVHKLGTTELLVEEETYGKYEETLKEYALGKSINMTPVKKKREVRRYLREYFNVISLEGYGLKGKDYAVIGSGMVLSYVEDLQKGNSLPIKKIEYVNTSEYMEMNLTTQNNLELTKNQGDGSVVGSLLWVVDSCKTSMGARALKKIIKNPLLNKEKILKRQEDIGYFIENSLKREEVREKLEEVYDIERLIGRVVMDSENGRDLISIKKSIRHTLEIVKTLGKNPVFELDIRKLVETHNLIEESINEDAPFSVREGGMIKDGYNKELDELRKISNDSKKYLLELELREKEKTGIKNLKIKYNKVFGYFIEVTRSNTHLVPEEYIRKQTLTNAERYIIEELKDYESKILTAKEKIGNLEYHLLKEISNTIREDVDLLQELAIKLAYLDLTCSLSEVAIKNKYVKPEIVEGYDLKIEGGRHPIVERLLKGEDYVKNDVSLDEKEGLVILTGPNMAGKSTYMKQLALIIILGQIGSYVPADYGKIGIVDKIFTRVGASDDLVSGRSTFMVEMSEVANILNSATENSFVILDEVGRGTSTFDGISIASSITTYIHNHIGCKTIFATHYHELTELEDELERAVNFRIEVLENKNDIVFLREIVRGGADKSYGIEVARLAGLPREVLNTSKKMLKHLENKRAIIEERIKGEQLSLFGRAVEVEEVEEKREISEDEERLLEAFSEIDPNTLTPLEALVKLNELKKII